MRALCTRRRLRFVAGISLPLLIGACVGAVRASADPLRHFCPAEPPESARAFATLSDSTVDALAGQYELVLVATSPAERDRQARGQLTLSPADTLQQFYTRALGTGPYRRWGNKPLVGTTDINLGQVSASTEGDPRSTDRERPGVVVHRHGEVWLGYAPVLDGSTTTLRITHAGPTGLWGTWEASYGYVVRVENGEEVPNPAGRFCALRTAE